MLVKRLDKEPPLGKGLEMLWPYGVKEIIDLDDELKDL